MFDLTYDELYKAADILWPGEAEDILDNPTDEQLMLILASLTKVPLAPLWGGEKYGGRRCQMWQRMQQAVFDNGVEV